MHLKLRIRNFPFLASQKKRKNLCDSECSVRGGGFKAQSIYVYC